MNPNKQAQLRQAIQAVITGKKPYHIEPEFTDFDGLHQEIFEDVVNNTVTERGRQQTGYLKYKLRGHEMFWRGGSAWMALQGVIQEALRSMNVMSFSANWDAWLLYYAKGVGVPAHVDPAPEGKTHMRVNVIVRPADYGGDLVLGGEPFYDLEAGTAVVFSSSRTQHEVLPPKGGSRVVLSVGALI
jgi:hypothetical protein